MKQMVTLLVIYLTALMSVPCSDTFTHDSCSSSSNKEVSLYGTDACSPLCSCACCSVSVPVVKLQLTSLPIASREFEIPKVEVRNASLHSSYTGNIWQPPKRNS